MSRSNPAETIPHPCTRWHEWAGDKGKLKYYDKEKKENVTIELPFDFVLLDRLSTIKGWHDASESGIFSNEVRDTRDERFVVKAFKMREPIAEGFYADIKDKIKANGGKFVINCYIAFTNDDNELAIGSLQFHGSALGAWMEFSQDKENGPLIYKEGIRIVGAKQGRKGGITFNEPVFEIFEIDEQTDEKATALDTQLQEYLRSYFKRTRVEQAQPQETPEETDEEKRVNEYLVKLTAKNPAEYGDSVPF